MVFAANLVERVAERVQKVVVGGDDRAVEVEFDDGLGEVHGAHLTFEFGLACAIRRDVRGELDDLVRGAMGVEHRVVRRADPYLAAAFADALVFAGVELAAAQLGPEVAVRTGRHVVGLAEDAVMLPRISSSWYPTVCRKFSLACRI